MQPGTEIGKMTRELFRCRRQRHAREDVRRRQGPGLCQLRVRKYIQLSLSIPVRVARPGVVTLSRRKGLKAKNCIRRTVAILLLGIFCSQGYPVRSTPNTSVVVLWLSRFAQHKSPATNRAQALRGYQYQSCLQQNLSVSPQQSAQIAPILADEGKKGTSNQKQQFAFERSKNTRGYVPPEAVRSAVKGDFSICSIRQ